MIAAAFNVLKRGLRQNISCALFFVFSVWSYNLGYSLAEHFYEAVSKIIICCWNLLVKNL